MDDLPIGRSQGHHARPLVDVLDRRRGTDERGGGPGPARLRHGGGRALSLRASEGNDHHDSDHDERPSGLHHSSSGCAG